ncbi:MAG: GntR family transcriptional regulator [Treponema sp.]|nr:GntR family transcriptional regulator [Treponema sp.]
MQTLNSKIVEHILGKIQNGEWTVGQMIPTEMEFCVQFGVSRPTVRIAMQQLVNKGYLIRTKGKGTFVTHPKTLEKTTIFIESFAEELKEQGLIVKTEVLEFRRIPASESIARRLQINMNEEMVKLTRLRYIKDSFDKGPIILTTSYFPKPLFFILKYDLERYSLREILKKNRIILNSAEKEFHAVTLDGKESRLLGEKPNIPAMLIKSVMLDEKDHVVYYTESYYPASRNNFILRISL